MVGICRKEADSEAVLSSGDVVVVTNAVQGRHQKGLYRNTIQNVNSYVFGRDLSRIKHPFVKKSDIALFTFCLMATVCVIQSESGLH